MTYDGDVLHIAPLQLKVPLHLVLVDLCASKDTVVILGALQVWVWSMLGACNWVYVHEQHGGAIHGA